MLNPKTTLILLLAASPLVWLLLAAAAPAQHVDQMWGLCPAPALPVTPDEDAALPPANAPAYVSSDYAEGKLNEIYALKGHVLIKRGPQRMEADSAVYDFNSGTVDAQGHVRFQQRGLITEGTSAHYNLDTDTGEFAAARYQFLEQHASGRADTIRHDESSDTTYLHHATYTTCDPNKPDWELRARDITLHHDEAEGDAYNVTLRFKNVPFLYFPYINFPLDNQRKSGLLPPTLAYSHSTGLDIGIPVYWNIAPNRDATITPRLIETRGLLTKGEFRYLSQDSVGQIQAAYLPDDKVFGANRGDLAVQDKTVLNPHWSTNVDATYVSDYRYLSDIGHSLSEASTTALERRMDLNYGDNNTSFLARVQGFQILDPTLVPGSQPYERLPQLLFATATPDRPFRAGYRLDGEYVRFERDSDPTGTRLNLTPSLAWPLESEAYFFTPKISLNYTQYQLSGQTGGAANDLSRTTPLYSIDTGLFMERETSIAQHSFLQTLEPRLYYLRVPYRDQNNLPLFDTGAYDFSFSQLFRDNRFTGADRLGDADQLSVAVTSRLIDESTGREWLSGSVGQIFYFADRLVNLVGVPVQTQNTSDIAAQASSHLSARLSSNLNLLWSPESRTVDQGNIQFQYRLDNRRIFNAGYRFIGTQINNPSITPLDQADISLLWLLNAHWQAVGRWNYSLPDHRTMEAMSGIQYESCCWVFRLTSRRYVSTVSGGSAQSIYLEMELKGLGSIGNSVEELLKTDILGYHTVY